MEEKEVKHRVKFGTVVQAEEVIWPDLDPKTPTANRFLLLKLENSI